MWVEITSSFPNFNGANVGFLEMDKYFLQRLYCTCHHLFMRGLKFNHIMDTDITTKHLSYYTVILSSYIAKLCATDLTTQKTIKWSLTGKRAITWTHQWRLIYTKDLYASLGHRTISGSQEGRMIFCCYGNYRCTTTIPNCTRPITIQCQFYINMCSCSPITN